MRPLGYHKYEYHPETNITNVIKIVTVIQLYASPGIRLRCMVTAIKKNKSIFVCLMSRKL